MRSAIALLPLLAGCAPARDADTIVIAASAVGSEGEALRARVARFEALHPGVRVDIRAPPDGGDERHQLYVQWFAAGAEEPDLLQLGGLTAGALKG
jgi:ABC-type glycerol-3-phosphate transport system substrate-binding protein